MSTTPVKVKRAVQDRRQGTPMPPRKRRRPMIVGVYNPPVIRLRNSYEAELAKFLRSVTVIMDHMELTKQETLIPLRRQLRRNHRESSSLHLYFKSLTYWKAFYSSYLTHNDSVMDCFRFDDLRSVGQVVDSHQLPDELVSFVTQQLIEWRELFKDVPWMKQYREKSEQIAEHEKKQQEQIERYALINEITLSIEMNNLQIRDFEPLADHPDQLCDQIVWKVSEAQRAKEIAEHLKNMPTLSKRSNTRNWCLKHYKPVDDSDSSPTSDDETSSSDGNSSINGDANSSPADLTSSSEGDIDSFFGAYGL